MGKFNIDTVLSRAELILFARGYIECAQWADGHAEKFELDTDPEFSESAKRILFIQAIKWAVKHGHAVNETFDYYGVGHAGHDFWLTRNGHGAGYWDGDLPDALGTALTIAANKAGMCELYLSDSGQIEVF